MTAVAYTRPEGSKPLNPALLSRTYKSPIKFITGSLAHLRTLNYSGNKYNSCLVRYLHTRLK